MIKLDRHLLVCDCADCATMFPPDRFEATWTYPEPDPSARRATGRLPIGHARARPAAIVWVDADDRLATDWPGMPGTLGAKVELSGRGPSLAVVGTRDPALAALADPVPLRRRALERLSQRCMVDYGLAPLNASDLIVCDVHGHGARALACAHVVGSAEPIDAVVLYDPDGDYPDCLCMPCLERYRAGDVTVAGVVCSRCQQRHLYRHRLVARSVYQT